MTDRLLQAVCSDCGHVKPSAFENAECERCGGRYEHIYFHNENSLRKLIEEWREETPPHYIERYELSDYYADELEALLEEIER